MRGAISLKSQASCLLQGIYVTCDSAPPTKPLRDRVFPLKYILHPEYLSTNLLYHNYTTHIILIGRLERSLSSMDPQYGNSGHHTPSTQVQQLAYTNQAPRPLSAREQDMLAHLDNLRLFLITAPYNHATGRVTTSTADTHPALNRFALPNGELVSCVYWQSLYHITGTDIVRALVFRFEAFGRPVRNLKKFEEGVFSDLRNLKPGIDACLEEPKVCQSIQFSVHTFTPMGPSHHFLSFCLSTNAYVLKRSRKCSTGRNHSYCLARR